MVKPETQTAINKAPESAINQVLEYEQAARDAVNEAKHQAHELLRVAHAKAQHIQLRADEHIRKVHACCDIAIASEIQQLDNDLENATKKESETFDNEDLLNQAVAYVSRQLTDT